MNRSTPHRSVLPWVVVGVATLVAVVGLAGWIGTAARSEPLSSGDARLAVTVTHTVTRPPSSPTGTSPTGTASAGPLTEVGPGGYEVGVDMADGRYRTAGPTVGTACYWSRSRDASGNLEAIIANGLPQGPGTVLVRAGEYFETSSCQVWRRIG